MAEAVLRDSVDNKYPSPFVAVDVVVFRVVEGKLQVLLIERRKPPFQNTWALPGGFIGLDEALEEAACRELREETGVSVTLIEQLYTFGDPGRDPRGRVISVAYLALLPPGEGAPQAGDDAVRAAWFPVMALPALAFDHGEMVGRAVERLRVKLQIEDAAFHLLPSEFTLSELQSVWEAVLGVSLDKRNFRRRVLNSGQVTEIGRRRSGEGRPARLYRYHPRRK